MVEESGNYRGPQHGGLGNENERVTVTSGRVVALDQYMLANQQFAGLLAEESVDTAVARYGGCIFKLSPQEYSVYRNARTTALVLYPRKRDRQAFIEIEDILETRDSRDKFGHVFVDTRCIAFFDADLLDDKDLLGSLQNEWRANRTKEARDVLRERGAAVRYGFDQQSDRLAVYSTPLTDVVALWPE